MYNMVASVMEFRQRWDKNQRVLFYKKAQLVEGRLVWKIRVSKRDYYNVMKGCETVNNLAYIQTNHFEFSTCTFTANFHVINQHHYMVSTYSIFNSCKCKLGIVNLESLVTLNRHWKAKHVIWISVNIQVL